MALHFGKRDSETHKSNLGSPTPPRFGQATAGTAPQGAPVQAAGPEQPVPSPAVSPSVAVPESGSKLTVGPNIKLKGVEITDCDTLVVEGMVEATMDSRVIQIAQQGEFKGSAEIDIAEIRGVFDGNLTVRQRMVIYATGKVTGKIRYGKVVIEEGGQLAGDIECVVAAGKASPSQSAMALAA
ncbi:MAG TPA: polymer-forming cytoskeletal protein [Hydrogenophaga sp.]|uniref:bactofilin family protein n=1 Tax=Hydrogenophaga sp. TaxID=1904254 RepID=UPI002CFCF2A1|nr:polymer-forming cytoskeletal protein [Hydrogenophaga sp.]HMN91613.1 polymer-forming cytoskeletal protein [Hydrogenophaga sp.]HMP10014.1 polymer-forming cytoskeletal protein [Hydrogenophaga sp.]